MGLSVKDDPRKVVDVAGRKWGEPANRLALSLIAKKKEDEDELPSVSVAIHNRSDETRKFTIRGWLDFIQVSVVSCDGVAAELTPYGKELFKPGRLPAPSEVTLKPGKATEADIPIGSVYQMQKGRYRVRASCDAPGGGRLRSNEIEIDT
jgi:hypothetical protein